MGPLETPGIHGGQTDAARRCADPCCRTSPSVSASEPVLPHDRRALRAARLSVAVIFFVNGAGIATWVTHIPTVHAALDLSEGTLGLVLLSLGIGALVAMPATGLLIPRVGSQVITRVSAVLACLALPLLLWPRSVGLQAAALFTFGLINGSLDISMNAQAVACQRLYGRSIMSSFHGLFSLGGLAGAALGAALLSLGIAPRIHVLAAAALFLVPALWALPHLLPRSVDAVRTGPFVARPSGALLGLGLLAFLVMMSEGSMYDWSALYLRQVLETGPGLAATGFAAFSLLMALGRVLGDGLVERFGAVQVMRVGAGFTAVGLGLALLVREPLAAIAGFGCVGLGLANAIPVLYTAAGRTPGVHPGTALAAVTTTGYVGLLGGPPLIGFVAEATSLTVGLALVVASCVLVSLAAGIVRPRTAPP